MKVAVATENPVKMRAVEQVLAEAFANEEIGIQQLNLELGLPEQPIGETIAAGALARAEAVQQHSIADFGIGIEAGLMQVPGTTRWVSVQICAIVDRDGKCAIGMGSGYELPKPILDAVLTGEPLREAFERLLHLEDPERRGAVYYLSGGLLDRMNLTMQAVRMALMPWMSDSIE